MTTFLLGAAVAILVVTALGLVRVLRGPTVADRMMGAQLLGTGTIGAVLAAGFALDAPATVDVALVLAALAPFATVGFVRHGPPVGSEAKR